MARAWSEAKFGSVQTLGVNIIPTLEIRLCLGMKPSKQKKVFNRENPEGKTIIITRRPKVGIRIVKGDEILEEVIFRPKLARRLETDIEKLAAKTMLRVVLDENNGMIQFEVFFPDCLYRTPHQHLNAYFEPKKPDNLAMAVTNAED